MKSLAGFEEVVYVLIIRVHTGHQRQPDAEQWFAPVNPFDILVVLSTKQILHVSKT